MRRDWANQVKVNLLQGFVRRGRYTREWSFSDFTFNTTIALELEKVLVGVSIFQKGFESGDGSMAKGSFKTILLFLVMEKLSFCCVILQPFLARRPGLISFTTISGTYTQSSRVIMDSFHSSWTVPVTQIMRLALSLPFLISSRSSWSLIEVKYLRSLKMWTLAPESRRRLGLLFELIQRVSGA